MDIGSVLMFGLWTCAYGLELVAGIRTPYLQYLLDIRSVVSSPYSGVMTVSLWSQT